MAELTPVRRERIQSRITKAILRDEAPEAIKQIISVNEIDKSDAEEMIRVAKKERVDVIRGQYMKKVRLGCFVLILGMAGLYAAIVMFGGVTRPAMGAGLFIIVLGFFQMIHGLVGISSAANRKGSFEGLKS